MGFILFPTRWSISSIPSRHEGLSWWRWSISSIPSRSEGLSWWRWSISLIPSRCEGLSWWKSAKQIDLLERLHRLPLSPNSQLTRSHVIFFNGDTLCLLSLWPKTGNSQQLESNHWGIMCPVCNSAGPCYHQCMNQTGDWFEHNKDSAFVSFFFLNLDFKTQMYLNKQCIYNHSKCVHIFWDAQYNSILSLCVQSGTREKLSLSVTLFYHYCLEEKKVKPLSISRKHTKHLQQQKTFIHKPTFSTNNN